MEGPQVGVLAWTLFGAGAVLGVGARSVGSRRRRRRRGRDGDFDWLLLQESRPISQSHPSLVLDDDLQQVVRGFDELIGRPEEELGTGVGQLVATRCPLPA